MENNPRTASLSSRERRRRKTHYVQTPDEHLPMAPTAGRAFGRTLRRGRRSGAATTPYRALTRGPEHLAAYRLARSSKVAPGKVRQPRLCDRRGAIATATRQIHLGDEWRAAKGLQEARDRSHLGGRLAAVDLCLRGSSELSDLLTSLSPSPPGARQGRDASLHRHPAAAAETTGEARARIAGWRAGRSSKPGRSMLGRPGPGCHANGPPDLRPHRRPWGGSWPEAGTDLRDPRRIGPAEVATVRGRIPSLTRPARSPDGPGGQRSSRGTRHRSHVGGRPEHSSVRAQALGPAMIPGYDLEGCRKKHRFEGWFSSSA